jgi:hypothetical protein
MKPEVGPYVVSFQAEPFYQETRYHWMICRAQKPDELAAARVRPFTRISGDTVISSGGPAPR